MLRGQGHLWFAAVGSERGCGSQGLCSIFTVVDGRTESGYTGEELGTAPWVGGGGNGRYVGELWAGV